MLIFSYILSAKTNTVFLINLKLKEIYNVIFEEKKIPEFSHNSYDDVCVFWPSYSPGRSHLLIDHSYMYEEYFFLINLIILPLEVLIPHRHWEKNEIITLTYPSCALS
jgi:hypothetical protein